MMFGRRRFPLLSLAVLATSSSYGDVSVVLAQDGEAVDIGPPAVTMLAGSSVPTDDMGGWSVSGSGNDIWSSYDEFHYLRYEQTGDVTVTVLVESFGPSTLETWRKAGIMFRNKNPDVDDRRQSQSMIQLTGHGIAHQSRTNDNGWSVSRHVAYDTSNVWLRLSREGNTVRSYVKREGEHGFMQFHAEEIPDLGNEYYVGLAVTSHNRNALGTAEFRQLEITDGAFAFEGGGVAEVGDSTTSWVQEVKEGVWAILAQGSDVGGTSDGFGYLSTEHTGDVEATLLVENVDWNNNDSKGGLMIRASDDPDAPHVSLLVKAGDGIVLYSRAVAGGDTTVVPNVGVLRSNVELRLVKSGNDVEASYRVKGGGAWYALGTANAALDDGDGTYRVGHAATSANPYQRGRSTAGTVVVTPL